MKVKSSYIFATKMFIPAIVFLLVVGVFPITYMIYCSMTNAYMLKPGQEELVAFTNYIRILKDQYFLQALKNTVIFTVICVIFETILGIVLAMFINSFKHGQKAFRTIILVPMMVPQITVSLMWQMMLS
nr:sugar ABC transporter permease [Butyrivibrio sp.]